MSSIINWGAKTAAERGALISDLPGQDGNVVGVHTGNLSMYRALYAAKGMYDPLKQPNLSNTHPSDSIGPFSQWSGEKIVSLDPFGATVANDFAEKIAAGENIRPTIAITRGRLNIPEVTQSLNLGSLSSDEKVLDKNGYINTTKIAIDPVWYLPGIAARIGVSEIELREAIHSASGGMYPDLLSKPEKKIFLPPIGNTSIYLFGDIAKLGGSTPVSLRVHDECAGSDVFGSAICTCRPYLTFAIEECIRGAQSEGIGAVIYGRKEGRSLGEVVKYLVYNARARQEYGDTPEQYFARTVDVAGVEDARSPELIPDAIHWLGIKKIDTFLSMSPSKASAIENAGIEIVSQVDLPADKVPDDAHVEISAKRTVSINAGKDRGPAPRGTL